MQIRGRVRSGQTEAFAPNELNYTIPESLAVGINIK